jgi:hypothetical protein
MRDDRGFFEALVADGRPLIALTGLSLVVGGLLAVLLSVALYFLPHDLEFVGMTPAALCAINECRVVYFMFHNRVSWGGSLIAVGTLYLWLAAFPLRDRQEWSWWLLAISGLVGFGSFFTYLGHGYLDTWHGIAGLALLPCFVVGLVQTFSLLPRPTGLRSLLRPAVQVPWRSSHGIGRGCLLAAAFGLLAAGTTILAIGTTLVFVPQDTAYLGLTAEDLHAINPRLVPLIAHDRASFGGGVCVTGLVMLFCVWCGNPSRGLWQSLCLAGTAGFATAIGVHPLIGYLDFIHLAPAVAGAAVFGAGLILTFKPMAGAMAPGTTSEPNPAAADAAARR